MIFRTDVLDTLDRAFSFLVADIKTGEILYATRPLETMFGYVVMNSLTGKNVDDLVPVSVRKSHPQHREQYAADPKIRPMGAGMKLQGQKACGELFPVIVTLIPAVISGKACVMATVTESL